MRLFIPVGMKSNKEQKLLEELLLGIRDVRANCAVLSDQSLLPSSQEAQLAFVRKGLVRLAAELDEIVEEAVKCFELGELKDR
jgi:hypothetical protein